MLSSYIWISIAIWSGCPSLDPRVSRNQELWSHEKRDLLEDPSDFFETLICQFVQGTWHLLWLQITIKDWFRGLQSSLITYNTSSWQKTLILTEFCVHLQVVLGHEQSSKNNKRLLDWVFLTPWVGTPGRRLSHLTHCVRAGDSDSQESTVRAQQILK